MIGDHIRTLKAGRWTHAIDCGDETVIVLAEHPAQGPRVRRSYRPEFVAGADTVEVVLHRERTFPADEVVARAYSRISDPALASMFRDSEAFAEWCITGRLPAAARNVAISVPGFGAPAASAPSPKVAPGGARPAGGGAKPAARRKPSRKAKPVRKAKPARRAKAAAKAKPARKAARTRARVARGTAARKMSRRRR